MLTDTPPSGMLLVAMAGGRRMENHRSALRSTSLNVTHIAFTHLSLAKMSHMILSNFKKIESAILPCIIGVYLEIVMNCTMTATGEKPEECSR